jgi:hypothetical protein
LFCDPTHACSAGQYCDTTGEYDPQHIRNSCVPSPFDAMQPPDAMQPLDAPWVCTPGTGMCASGNVQTCDSNGQWSAPAACPLGCFTDGTRCWDVDPSNGLAAALDDARTQPSYTLIDGAQFDTDNGDVVNGDGNPVSMKSVVITPPGVAPDIRVFEVKSLTMGSVKIVNTNKNGNTTSFAIVSDGDVTITGVVDISGAPGNDAPGFAGCSNTTGGAGRVQSTSGIRYAGAGGGSYARSGGRGGNNRTSNGSAPGTLEGNDVIIPLRGGCNGGLRVYDTAGGGTGGGAIQIVSRSLIKLTGNGGINAGGGGAQLPASYYGGGGGGSGGAILLEAPAIVLSGAAVGLAANGGGGSANCPGGAGQSGKLSTGVALGGACTGSTVSNGGNGAAGVFDATQGVDFVAGVDNGFAGGGGGGAGYIRINTISTTSGYSTLNGAFTSGSLTRGAVGQR